MDRPLEFQRCDVARCPHRVDYLEHRLRHLEEQIRAADQTIEMLTERLGRRDTAVASVRPLGPTGKASPP